MAGYKILDHTADVGIAASGDTLAEALAFLAKGMFALIADAETIEVSDSWELCVSSTDAAMRASANFAWANRQCITHWTRLSFETVFGVSWSEMGMRQVYDVSHNMAKIEDHVVDGKETGLCVHRKGATRSFPAGHPDVPARYRDVGQPVFVPGDMGRCSYVAVGDLRAMELSFGSTCHGAGRVESRTRARKLLKGRDIQNELEQQGIIAMAHGWGSLAEEASLAYKDVEEVMRVADGAGLSRRVARLRPLGVIKG